MGYRVALIAILALGAILRFTGLGFGLPLSLRPDELVFRKVARNIAETGDWNPHFFSYPGLAYYLPYGAFRVGYALENLREAGPPRRAFAEWIADVESSLPFQRALSAFFGTAAILLVERLARRLGGPAGGLLSALFLAVAFLPVRDSHFGTCDSAAAAASTLALLAVVDASRSGRTAAFARAGACTGLAAAIRFVPVVLALPILGAVANAIANPAAANAAAEPSKDPSSSRRDRDLLRVLGDRRTWIAAACVVAGFAAGSPFTPLALGEARSGMSELASGYLAPGYRPLETLGGMVRDSLPVALGGPLAALSVVAVLWAAVRGPSGAGLVAAFVLAYAGALTFLPVAFARYVIPIVPSLCVLSALTVARASGRLAVGRRAAAIAAVAGAVFALEPLGRSIAIDRLFARATTTELAERFVTNVLPGSAVLTTPHDGVRLELGKDRFLAWDPLRWPRGPDLHLVVARHPHPTIGDGYRNFLPSVEGDPRCVKVFESRAADERAWTSYRTEPNDFFFYPLAGFRGVRRGGADLVVFRYRTADPPPSGPTLRPPRLEIRDGGPRGPELAASVGPEERSVAFYVRIVSADASGPDASVEPMCAPGDRGTWPLPARVPARRFLVSAAASSLDGPGAWSEYVPVESLPRVAATARDG